MPAEIFVDSTYVNTCVQRVLAMLAEVSSTFDPPVKRIADYIELAWEPPFWWVYPGRVTPEELASHLNRQPYALNMRLVIGKGDQGYDGKVSERLWLWMPTVLNYFNRRKGLIYQAGQSIPKYLDPGHTRIQQIGAFGTFDNLNHVGIQFQMTLAFTVSFTPYPGN